MSFLDKLTAAITPPESAEDRADARATARSYSSGNDWLGNVISQHEQIESAFDAARSAGSAEQANAVVRQLAGLLTAHATAEEAVLYPALVMEGHKLNATSAYQQHQVTKVQIAELETLAPLSEDWVDKLEHIRGAVLHHMYEEEKDWLPKIMEETSRVDHSRLNSRYAEEYDRYMSGASKAAG